jgi:hypothetical protein
VPRVTVCSRIALNATGSFSTSDESPSTSESATTSRSDGLMLARLRTTTRAFSSGESVEAYCCFRNGAAGKVGTARVSSCFWRVFSSLFSSEFLYDGTTIR